MMLRVGLRVAGFFGIGVTMQALAPKGHDIPAQGNALGLRRLPRPQAGSV